MNKTKHKIITFLLIVISLNSIVYANAIDINKAMADRYSIEEVVDKEYLGQFTITFYCNCEICCGKWAYGACANGEMPKDNHTIAVDDSLIPLNSFIEIDGFKYTYKACDTGSAIKGNKIDIYVSDHNKCLELGIKKKIKVWMIKE